MEGGRKRIVDRMAELDGRRFTGRREILANIESCLDGDDPASVLLVHGPGGIGKSALLREIGRQANERGRQVWAVDGRQMSPLPHQLEEVLAEARVADEPVVLFDSFEEAGALAGALRDELLPGFDARALIVIASRSAPDPNWFRDGWENITRAIRLRALPDNEAAELLRRKGLVDGETIDALVTWAKGSPLALEIGADAALGPNGLELGDIDLNELIIKRIAGSEFDSLDADVAEIAAIARAVDSRLLSAILPGRPTRDAFRQLNGLSFAEPIGGVTTLHALVREAIQSHLREQAPARYHDLRRRIADHLFMRASNGEPRLLMDLVELIDSPEVRWGLGADSGADIRVEAWQPGRMDEMIERYVRDLGGPGWWEDLRPLLEDSPEMGMVAKDAQGRPVSFCVATSPDNAPQIAWDDPVFGPLLQDAAASGRRTFIWRESHFFHDVEEPAPFALLNTASILHSGTSNVELSYIVDIQNDDESRVFFEAVGATRRPELDSHVDPSRPNPCWVIDHGPGGMLGSIRATIYLESGVEPPAPDREIMRAAALDAMRDLYRPEALAANPLAEGETESERCAKLRDLLAGAVAETFGDSPTDQLMREIVEMGDLDPQTSHKQAMVNLAVSRTTYFRRLAEARERVADTIVSSLKDHGPG